MADSYIANSYQDYNFHPGTVLSLINHFRLLPCVVWGQSTVYTANEIDGLLFNNCITRNQLWIVWCTHTPSVALLPPIAIVMDSAVTANIGKLWQVAMIIRLRSCAALSVWQWEKKEKGERERDRGCVCVCVWERERVRKRRSQNRETIAHKCYHNLTTLLKYYHKIQLIVLPSWAPPPHNLNVLNFLYAPDADTAMIRY